MKIKKLNEGTQNKRIASTTEFDNGYIIHDDWKIMSDDEAEELARQKSIDNPDKIYYVQYDDIMNPSSDFKWKNGQKLIESKESEESELITQYINNGEFDKLEKVHNGTNVVWKLKEPLSESLEIATIGDYITDHYDFDDIDDKYSCINSIRDSFKDEKTISKEELEQFIGSHNGRDKVNESKSIKEGWSGDTYKGYSILLNDDSINWDAEQVRLVWTIFDKDGNKVGSVAGQANARKYIDDIVDEPAIKDCLKNNITGKFTAGGQESAVFAKRLENASGYDWRKITEVALKLGYSVYKTPSGYEMDEDYIICHPKGDPEDLLYDFEDDAKDEVLKSTIEPSVQVQSINESKSTKESKSTHCVYFSMDGGKTQEIEFEGTEDECQDYIEKQEADNEFGNEAPERFIKRLNESTEDFASVTSLADECGENTHKVSSRDIRFRFVNEDDETKFINKLYELDIPYTQAAYGVIISKSSALDESTQPLYIIKDKHGNQLSAPNSDDGELWDRVASMEARGRTGLSVVAYVDKTSKSEGPYIELSEPQAYIDELDFAGAVEIKGNKIYADEETLRQLAGAIASEYGWSVELKEELNEASYGGAFDIRDDQFFTREDIENAAEEVMGHITETFTEPYHLGGTWFENNQWIVNVQGEQFDEYEVSLPVDMRKIKEPWHLKRAYANEMAAKLIGQIKEYNGMNEAVTSSSFEFDDDIDDLSYYYDDEQLKSGYMYIKSKSIPDSDGFMTDYTMYQDIESGEYVFIFGDNEVYTPDNSEFDHECETAEEADEWFNNYNGFEDMDEGYPKHKTLEEAYDPYDPADGWTEEDIALHKSIDWKARNYEPYVDENDTFEGEVVAYGLPGGPRKAKVTFAKNFSANPIFSPSYKPTSNPFEHTVGFMYDGHKHNGYLVMDRTETQDVYDALSH